MMTAKQSQEPSSEILNSGVFLYSFENEYPANDVYSTCPQENQQESQHPLVQKDFMPTFYNPFENKHRRRTSRAQFKMLESSFLENTKPNATMRRWLGQKLDMTPRSVQVWFQNRRAKAKSQLNRQHPQPPSPSSSLSPSSSSSSTCTYSGHFETPLHNNDFAEDVYDQQLQLQQQTTTWPAFVNPVIKEEYCQQQPHSLNEMTQIQWQQPSHQQMTYDPLSMLMDSPDLISWCSSSPISSPLPSLLSPSTHSNQQQMDPNSLQMYSPHSPPTPYRRSSFPVNFDMHVDPSEKDALRRLSEPIFDFQSPSAASFPYMMMDLQQQQQQQQQYPFNHYL